MKISWIKYEDDNRNFRIAEKLGMNVNRLKDPEEVDKKMAELINNNYNTIILSKEVSFFSQDIIKKYKDQNDINIIIGS